MWYKFAQTHPLVEKAKERFNVTKNPDQAGFVLDDGQFLNLSGGNSYREMMHEEIRDIMPPVETPDDKWSNPHAEYVVPFMTNTNSLRVSRDGYEWSVEIHTPPTVEQIKEISKHQIKGKDFHYEIPPFGRNAYGTLENTNPSAVFNFLMRIRENMLRDKP
jgi:hypothetical protein